MSCFYQLLDTPPYASYANECRLMLHRGWGAHFTKAIKQTFVAFLLQSVVWDTLDIKVTGTLQPCVNTIISHICSTESTECKQVDAHR